ncbi:HEPN domain-containing protein [Undibacterium terreum]|uniref:Apea-like HEPN domain-containing protein n=1 Tax=Undibacterium terreum TaxID=1224302 RepID=A0A916ULT0_9BURK|nr:HEPN domain-containing protein [Undibacterium terreum]GGC78062.1 hypothetical protein GCM10011396_26570 [Undibacterium terreum]
MEQSEPGYGYVSLGGGGTITPQTIKPETLFRLLAEYEEMGISWDDEKRLAIELLNSALVETSLNARFLNMMFMFESLAVQEQRPQPIVDLVNSFIETTKLNAREIEDGISKDIYDTIISQLGNLKNDSINKSLQKVALEIAPNSKYMNLSADNFMRYCYNKRSNLAHGGNIGMSNEDQMKMVIELQKLSIDAIVHICKLKKITLFPEDIGPPNINMNIGPHAVVPAS